MKKQWWIPILIITLFCIESLFVNFFPSHLFSQYWIVSPHFLFLFLIFMTVYYDKKLGLIYAFIMGLVMDVVFIDILGIYLLWFPVTIYLVSKLMRNWHTNLIIIAIVSLLSIALIEFGVYGMFTLLHIANMPFGFYLIHRLIPTLFVNFVFYLLFSYWFKRYFTRLRKLKDGEEGMFQS